MTRARIRSWVVTAIKLTLAIVLVGYLIRQAQSDASFENLREGNKHWGLLLAAVVCCLGAVLVSFVRWFLLVQALGLPFTLREAIRLGFLGYLMNFVSLGAVGGDFFKALSIAHRQPGRRTEAVATVVVDRLIGLFALLLIASTAILVIDIDGQSDDPRLQVVCRTTLIATAVTTGCIALLIGTGVAGHVNIGRVGRIPWIGSTLARLLTAVQAYRKNLSVLAVATGMSFMVHILLTACIFLIGLGLPGEPPSFASHLFIAPLSFVVGAITPTPNGLGTFEGSLDFLYGMLAPADAEVASSGTIVGFGYRLVTVVIAIIGVGYFFSSRREVAEVMHDAEVEEQSDAD